MRSNTLLMIAMGTTIAAVLYAVKSGSTDLVTGKSGHQWRVKMLSNTSGVKTYEIFSPAGSWGPHGELSVVRYSQAGSDIGHRYIRGAAVGVPPEMFAGALLDFGLIPPPALS